MGGKRPGRGAPAKRSVPAGCSAEGAGVGPRGHPAELRMWPLLVVITPPASKLLDEALDSGKAARLRTLAAPGSTGAATRRSEAVGAPTEATIGTGVRGRQRNPRD